MKTHLAYPTDGLPSCSHGRPVLRFFHRLFGYVCLGLDNEDVPLTCEWCYDVRDIVNHLRSAHPERYDPILRALK